MEKMYLNTCVHRPTPASVLLALFALGCSWPMRGDDAPVELTKAAEVRALAAEEARQARAVRLQGQLLLVTTPGNAMVLFDKGEGIYVETSEVVDGSLRLGDFLEVHGVSDAGDFAPIVRAQKVIRLSSGGLPAPRVSTIAELNAGGYDAAWVELRGIVRACVRTPPASMPVSRQQAHGEMEPVRSGPSPEVWTLTIAQGDDKMKLQVQGHVVPSKLVDAEVSIKAVVFNVHNATRQFVSANLQVPDVSMIEVRVPPQEDPFSLPVQPIGSLLSFSRDGFTGHRVHVRGVVTGHRGGDVLWLSDGNRGLRIASQQPDSLTPGDEVEVVGFPDHGSYTPSLSDAVFRKIATKPVPAPHMLRAKGDVAKDDANLVKLDAKLVEIRDTEEGRVLVLDWDGRPVLAAFLAPVANDEVEAWQPGSYLRVVGICVVGQTRFLRPTGLWVADDLQVLLRSANDVAVLKQAPWFSPQRALRIVIIILGVVLAALIGLAIAARRQIALREEARKLAEVEFAAMLAERNRLAREIHDTLAQELNAVSMQLELARNSNPGQSEAPVMKYLSVAHQIVRKCLADARDSIWNMRSHILEKKDLAGALQEVAEQLKAGRDCRVNTRVSGHPRRLPPLAENNLLRIGQEAASNALKHGNPRNIDISLSYEKSEVRLVVCDDGKGFEPAMAEVAPSHFGLRGMRERVEQMNGALHINTGPDGTRVEARVVIPA